VVLSLLHGDLQRSEQGARGVEAEHHGRPAAGPRSGFRKSMFTVWSCGAWTADKPHVGHADERRREEVELHERVGAENTVT